MFNYSVYYDLIMVILLQPAVIPGEIRITYLLHGAESFFKTKPILS
jgi:hypothetical protein